jgi:hypothetical protein
LLAVKTLHEEFPGSIVQLLPTSIGGTGILYSKFIHERKVGVSIFLNRVAEMDELVSSHSLRTFLTSRDLTASMKELESRPDDATRHVRESIAEENGDNLGSTDSGEAVTAPAAPKSGLEC